METLKTFAKKIRKAAHRPRNKKIFYALCALVVVLWVMFRFAVIGAQNRLVVYNPARAALTDGVPVTVINMEPRNDILRTPIMVRRNRAYVAAERAQRLRAGQKIGNGTIASVSQNIDLDTGMYVVQTNGVADGLQFAEFNVNGFFVPVYALDGDALFVVRDGVATRIHVKVAGQDSDKALIKSGLNTGDVVILTRVADGVRVQVK